jgi:hypothetical protein
VDRAARRVAAEEKNKKTDAKKARARERTRARDALEKLHRRQERDGLPREPSPETPATMTMMKTMTRMMTWLPALASAQV